MNGSIDDSDSWPPTASHCNQMKICCLQFDTIRSYYNPNPNKIKVVIKIAIAIAVEIEIKIAISIQIIIEIITTTIQNIVRLCSWTRSRCRLQWDTERWMVLSCKGSTNSLLIWYGFIKLTSSIHTIYILICISSIQSHVSAKPTNIGNAVESVFDAVSNSILPVKCVSSCV